MARVIYQVPLVKRYFLGLFSLGELYLRDDGISIGKNWSARTNIKFYADRILTNEAALTPAILLSKQNISEIKSVQGKKNEWKSKSFLKRQISPVNEELKYLFFQEGKKSLLIKVKKLKGGGIGARVYKNTEILVSIEDVDETLKRLKKEGYLVKN